MPHARGLPSRRAGAVRESGHGGMGREAPGLAVSHQGRTGLHGQRDRHVQDDAVLFGPEAVKAYATGAGAYGPAWVSGPQSALSGKAEAQLALRVPRPAVATIPVPDAGSARTPQGVAVTHVTLLEAQATAQAASEALKADMATPALTPGEIEGLAGNVRARLDDALHYTAAALPQGSVHPVCERLRTAARAMQQLAEAALNARPPLAIRTAGLACNFHLLAHRLYGDFTRADELRRINPQVRNPNFIAKDQELLVYVR